MSKSAKCDSPRLNTGQEVTRSRMQADSSPNSSWRYAGGWPENCTWDYRQEAQRRRCTITSANSAYYPERGRKWVAC